MKILSLKFKNLNSLRGEHQIDFSRAPFSETGLFAITGPTGAGKTTILDAITVALYGKVHRHNRDVDEIMSRHTGECYSELEFEARNKIYRAKWSLHRAGGKPDGKLQNEKMELSELRDGAYEMIGEHRVTQIRQQIEVLCGLDYQQFLRSVILCQGDFTQFLKSTDRDRSFLLENITGTEIYSQISVFVYDKLKEEREKLTGLEGQLGNVKLLSSEEKQEFEQQYASLLTMESGLRENQKQATTNISWLENIAKLRHRKMVLAAELDAARQSYNTKKDDFEKLKWHEHALRYKPQYDNIKALAAEEEKVTAQLASLEATLPALEARRRETVVAAEEAVAFVEKAEGNLELQNPAIDETIKKDEGIKGVQAYLISATTELNALEPEIIRLQTQKAHHESRIRQLAEELQKTEEYLRLNAVDGGLEKQVLVFDQQLLRLNEVVAALAVADRDRLKAEDLISKGKQSLERHAALLKLASERHDDLVKGIQTIEAELMEGLGGKTLELLEAEVEGLPVLINNYQQQLETVNALVTFRKEYAVTQSDMKAAGFQQGVEAEKLVQLEAEHLAARKLLEAREQLLEAEQRVQKYEADRVNLREGEPCGLCGSVHHPYVATGYQPNLSDARRQLDAQRKVVEALDKQLLGSRMEVQKLALIVENAAKASQEKLNAGRTLKAKFESLNTELPNPVRDKDPMEIEQLRSASLRQWETLKNKLQHIKQRKDELSRQQKQLDESRIATINLESELAVTQGHIKNNTEQLDRNEAVTAQLLERQAQAVAEIGKLLEPFQVTFDQHAAAGISGQLNLRMERYQEAEKRLKKLTEESTAISKALDPLTYKLQETFKAAEKTRENIRSVTEQLTILRTARAELFGDKDPVAERTRLSAEIRTSSARRESALKLQQEAQKTFSEASMTFKQLQDNEKALLTRFVRLQEELTNQLHEVGIGGIEALADLLLPDDVAIAVAKNKKVLEESISTNQELVKVNDVELETELGRALTGNTLESLQSELNEIADALSALNQEIGRIKGIFAGDEATIQQHEKISGKIRMQQLEFSRWNKLCNLIGSADGNSFRMFAQGLTLARLTELANKHLAQLTDRYSILKSKEKDLGLEIEDHYQADATRPMATLSGGESFLVSLALALGLSDLASHKVQINTLFIDEGFGTLDADTLDVAISALENLQAKGKTVGIISHVEALKDRIGTQVQVEKQPGGSSRIRVQHYGVPLI